MKIAVYTITKNEENNMARWAFSARDADLVIIGDTGSEDETAKAAAAHGAEVVNIRIDPWRFDDARNALLAQIPLDIDMCIALDADEILLPGWRAKLEEVSPGVTRPRYKYVWSWLPDGSEDLSYTGDKIHARKGYRWRHPVHEVITPYLIEEVQEFCGVRINHYPDSKKPRSYLPLLELAVREDPNDDRNAHYLAREYMFAGRYKEAKREFIRHLALPSATWAAERSQSLRYIARCDRENEIGWLLKAIEECPNWREPWIDLSLAYYHKQMWNECYRSSTSAMDIENSEDSYMSESRSFGPLIYDLAAISAYNIGDVENAIKYGKMALELSPGDQRLQGNLEWYVKLAL